jgi:hypothetical protein
VLAYREGKYHGQIKELATAAGLHPTTLRNAKLVCSRIPVSCRRDELSWAHHCEVGKAFTAAQDITYWLQVAVEEDLTRMELRQRIRMQRKSPELAIPDTGHLDTEHFRLLRELRAMDRHLQKNRPHWEQWSAQSCRLAQEELRSLTAFLQSIQARAKAA